MMKFLKKGTFASLFLLQILGSTIMALGQATVTGTVTDSLTGIPVENASIEILDSKTGTTIDHGGNFSLTVGPGNHTLQIRALGFLSRQITISLTAGQNLDLGRIVLVVASIGLKEVTVMASEAIERKTPVAVSMIRAEAIQA
ncbi:MAG: carboxypeptidase-like regulatory domain-containing protein, partial [Bacteroidales bacterium]|nr:carboxypeptidase-like regulatory domain-containing protein [Bacteroidales bacterium]